MPVMHAPTTFHSPTKNQQENTKSTTIIMASHPETKVDCSRVYIKKSLFSNAETGDFDGAFAACPIKKGRVNNFAFSLEPRGWLSPE
jgi:hypothetical protein